VPPTNTPEPTEEAQAAAAASGLPEIPDFPAGKELSSKDLDEATDAAQQVAKSVEMTDFTWKAWLISPETTWEEANDHFQKFFEETGWTVEHSLVKEDPNGTKMGMVLDEGNKIIMMTVVGQGPQKDQKALMVIVGQVSDKTAALMALGMDAMSKQETAEPAATEEPAQVEQPAATEEPAPAQEPTATTAPAQPASPYAPPAGKGTLVMLNCRGDVINVDVIPVGIFQELAPKTGPDCQPGAPIFLDPGDYTLKASIAGQPSQGEATITIVAGQILPFNWQ
jgi:hypothetical protein